MTNGCPRCCVAVLVFVSYFRTGTECSLCPHSSTARLGHTPLCNMGMKPLARRSCNPLCLCRASRHPPPPPLLLPQSGRGQRQHAMDPFSTMFGGGGGDQAAPSGPGGGEGATRALLPDGGPSLYTHQIRGGTRPPPQWGG